MKIVGLVYMVKYVYVEFVELKFDFYYVSMVQCFGYVF